MPQSNILVSSIKIVSTNESVTDISSIFKLINIRESIDLPLIRGDINIEDDMGLYEFLPILGQEWIFIELELDNYTTTIEGFVYKVSNFKRINARRSQYTLHFCSYESYLNQTKRVKRSFRNTAVSDIIQDILRNDIKTQKRIIIDPTFGDITYIPTNITPFQSIRELLKLAVSNTNDSSSYIFFENRLGYMIASVSELLTQEPNFTYRYSESVGNNISNNDLDDLSIFFTMENFQIINYVDTFRQATNGMFASQLHTIDLISRNIQTYNYKYHNEFDKVNHLNKLPIYKELPDTSDATVSNQYFNYVNISPNNQRNDYIKANNSDISIDHSNITRLSRIIQSSMMDSYTYKFDIPGNIALVPSNVINVEIPSTSGEIDIILSGNVLITSISHTISGDGSYKQTIETIKDSFSGDI